MRLQAKQGHISRISKLLGIKRKNQIARVLGISPASISYSIGNSSIPLEWLFLLLERNRISPAWILRGQNPPLLHYGYDLLTPWPDGGEESCSAQFRRVKHIFPGISKLGNLFRQYPVLVPWKHKCRRLPAAGVTPDVYLWILFHYFGINPAWITKGQSPAFYFIKRAEILTENLKIYDWSLEYEKNLPDNASPRMHNNSLRQITDTDQPPTRLRLKVSCDIRPLL